MGRINNKFDNSHFDAMFDACPHVTVVFDAAFSPVKCNLTAVAFFGFSDKDELNRGLMQRFSECIPAFQQDASPTIPVVKRLEYAKKFGSIDFETEMLQGEKRVPMRVTLKRLGDTEDSFIAGYFTDISELKQSKSDLFRQEYLLRQINRVATLLMSSETENFADAMSSVLKILAQSVEAERMCIYENDDHDNATSCRLLYAYGGESKEGLAQSIEYAKIEETYVRLKKNRNISKLAIELTDGEREYFGSRGTKSILIIPVFFLDKFWGILSLENRKNDRQFTRIEASVIQSGGILAVSAELRNQINKSLIIATEQAQASDKAKTDFLSRMSHEIRTPLNAVIGMTALAKKTTDMTKIHENLEKIEFASAQLLDIINDILDMSKIESGKLELSSAEFDLEELIKSIVSMMRVQADAKGQSLTYSINGTFDRLVILDEMRLRQVLVNLVSNAVKFTGKDGRINISADCEGDRLQISVRDTGIGIPPEQQKKLFRSFEQADGGIARRYGGTGLGLAISKRLVSMMGGMIDVVSTEGEGSTFFFSVRFKWGGEKKLAEAEGFATAENADWTGKRLLLVEDVEINREIVISLLEETNIIIDSACDGAIALKMFSENPGKYDLVLMDVQMPEMDGLEATRRMRAIGTDYAKNVPIIAMTANAFSGDIQNCLAAGMNDHLAKPINVELLYKKVGDNLFSAATRH